MIQALSKDTRSVASSDRVYAIGDIHGRCDLLVDLLELIEQDGDSFDDGRTVRLVFLGDYIDRGDDSRAVLDLLCDLADNASPDFSFLSGNHEAALLAFLRDPAQGRDWLNFGGLQTLASYGVPLPGRGQERQALLATRDALQRALGRHHGFLTSLSLLERSGDVIFTHAGLNPSRPDPRDDTHALLWGCAEFLTPDPRPGCRVVHGHFDAPKPLSLPGRICVDTGAYYSGRLTAVRLDAGEDFLVAGG